jgi:monoamine oxidase
MNRRELLILISLLGSAAILSRCIGLLEEEEAILVVGAEFTGLRTAKTLQNCGYKVIVFEARERSGGCIWTSRQWNDKPLDLEVSWIHRVSNNPVAHLAKENHLDTAETDYDNHWIYGTDGQGLSDTAYDGRDETIAQLQKKCTPLMA